MKSESIEGFEDLIVWQKARKLTKEVYYVTGLKTFSKDVSLSGQIQRAAVSVMSNIAEGSERETTLEYLRFLTISKASCAELRSQLYVAFDIGYLKKEEFNRLLDASKEIARLLGGLKKSLERRKNS